MLACAPQSMNPTAKAQRTQSFLPAFSAFFASLRLVSGQGSQDGCEHDEPLTSSWKTAVGQTDEKIGLLGISKN